MQLFVDVFLMWWLMLGWAVVGLVVGAFLVGGFVLIKEWSEQ